MEKKLEMAYDYARETKTCYVYQHGERGNNDHQTLYIKKDKLSESGMTPGKPIKVTIEEA